MNKEEREKIMKEIGKINTRNFLLLCSYHFFYYQLPILHGVLIKAV